MAIRIEYREYPDLGHVVAVATGTVSGKPFGTSGQGSTRVLAMRDLRCWLRFTRHPANRYYTYRDYRRVHPIE